MLGWLQLPTPDTPALGIVPVPTAMFVLGVLLGLGLGALSRWWARVGARHRRSVIGTRLTASVAVVGDERVVAPVAQVLGRHRETREHLARAGA